MQGMKTISLLPALLVFASCSAPADHFSVGQDQDFCVPRKGFIAQNVWYAPKDSPGEAQGFSFGGCHRLNQSDQAGCSLPKEFISANVWSLSKHRAHTWGELKRSADYELTSSEPGVERGIDEATGMLLLKNTNISPLWSIWKPGPGHVEVNEMMDADELFVECSQVEKFPGGTDGLGSKGEFACSRFVRGKHYSLLYRFVSKQSIPLEAHLHRLESAIFNQLESWRCMKPSE